MALELWNQFERSYDDASEYPTNLCDTMTYPTTRHAQKQQLEHVADLLCVETDECIDVPFLDLLIDAQCEKF